MTRMQEDRSTGSVLAGRPRLTPWIDGALTPAREGVYQRRSPAGPYACWDGATWYFDSPSAPAAAAQVEPSALQAAAWRGLTEAPAAPCFACRGHTVIDRGVDAESGLDLIEECPEC
jgi:hypothetical protein